MKVYKSERYKRIMCAICYDVMKEIIPVILIALAVTTPLLQIVGFITPYWYCATYNDNATVSYNQTTVSYNQTTVSYNQTTVSYNQTTVSYNQTTVSYNQHDQTADPVCDMKGLFSTCDDPNCLMIVFMCTMMLIVSLSAAFLLTKNGYNMLTAKGTIYWQFGLNPETVPFLPFLLGQIWAGAKTLQILIKYDEIGWSAMMFSPLFALVGLLFRPGPFVSGDLLISSFLFGLHLALTGILVLIYFKAIKPYFERRKPQRPKTIELRESVISENVQYLPSYWSKTSDPIREIDITSEAGFIKLLVYHLWSPKDVGMGRDAAKVGNNKFINITKVERVENVALFLKYNENREELLRKVEKVRSFKDLSQLSTSEVTTTQLIENIPELTSSPLGREIHHDINEHYLFHGTVPQNVKSICRTGLSVYYVARAMFGKGVYTAENPTKSDQYTDYPGETAVHKDKKLLLCRVCLGELYILKKAKDKLIFPPCRTCYASDCKKHELTFDSVVGDVAGLRFREFIVYSDYRVYPEYIITYDRVEDDTEMREYIDD